MIQQNTLNVVYPLAELFQERGMKVSAMPTTAVDKLCQACHYDVIQELHPIEVDPVQAILRGSSTAGVDGAVQHDLTMDEVVEVVAETVKGNLHVARNVVNPIIKEVVADLREHMQFAENALQGEVNVAPDFYEAVWNSPTMDAMIDRYVEVAFKTIPLQLEVPQDQEGLSLENLVYTGSVSFDEDLDEVIDRCGEDTVYRLYSYIWGGPSGRSRELNEVLKALGRNETLLIHLMARRLIDNPTDGVDMSLPRYNAYMADIIAQTGRHLNRLRQRRLRAQRQNILVDSYPPERSALGRAPVTIEVNGDLYNQWLEKGGTPEAIIGAFITDQARQADALMSEKARYEKAWERHHRVLITGQRLNRFNHGVEGMRRAVSRQINDLDDEVVPVSKEILHKKLEENLSSLYGHWYETPYEYARKVVCKTIFPHTMALQILCAIDHVSDDHPGIEVREAALLATIEVVGTWVAKLCKTERV